MQVIQADESGLTVRISAAETRDWAHRPGAAWPCSTLSAHRLVVALDGSGDLVDFGGPGDADGRELTAMLADELARASEQRHRSAAQRRQLRRYADDQAVRV